MPSVTYPTKCISITFGSNMRPIFASIESGTKGKSALAPSTQTTECSSILQMTGARGNVWEIFNTTHLHVWHDDMQEPPEFSWHLQVATMG
eukprot:4479343-Amphidinium_carterae.2